MNTNSLYHCLCTTLYSINHNQGFENLDRSLNYKRERFKVFEVELELNYDDIIINLIIN